MRVWSSQARPVIPRWRPWPRRVRRPVRQRRRSARSCWLAPRIGPSHDGLVVLTGRLRRTCDEAASERRVCDETDIQLFEEREELFDLTLEQGIRQGHRLKSSIETSGRRGAGRPHRSGLSRGGTGCRRQPCEWSRGDCPWGSRIPPVGCSGRSRAWWR